MLIAKDQERASGYLSPERIQTLTDVAAQQGAWWFAMLMVRSGRASIAWIGTALIVLGHLGFSQSRRGRILAIALFASALGLTVDSTLRALGAVEFPSATSALLPPAWMVGLWAAFGVSFLRSLSWLPTLPLWTLGPLGGAAGVIAYRAGAALGVLDVEPSLQGHGSVAFAWALAIVSLSLFARRLER